jgi:hypothetical protein
MRISVTLLLRRTILTLLTLSLAMAATAPALPERFDTELVRKALYTELELTKSVNEAVDRVKSQ